MTNYIYRAKIKTVISIVISFLILVILIQGTLAVYNIYNSRNQALNMASLIISNDTKNMSDLFSRIDGLINNIETDKSFIYTPANTLSNDFVEDSKRFNSMRERFHSMVSNSAMNTSFYNSFFFLNDELPLSYIAPDYQKEINLDINVASSNIYSISSIKNAQWLQDLNDSTERIIWTKNVNNRTMLCYAKKINMHLIEHNELVLSPLGVFYASYDLSALLSQLALTEVYPSAAITLLYNDNVIYETTPSDTYENNTKNSYTSSIYPGFTLITNISQQDIIYPYAQQLIIGIIMLVVALFCSIIILSYINNAIVYPITHMAKHLLTDERSELSYYKTLNPEIDVLYKNHNYMVEHTKQVMAESRISYYKMLQAQINPHFTYNVLNSISAISLMNGDFKIPEIISNLVEMLRYGINDPEILVPLSMELEITERFVKIQNFRSEKPITIEYDISEDLYSVTMPKLTLQPLIENSIFHCDAEVLSEGIYIKVSAFQKDNCTVIEISDFNHADASALNRHLIYNDMYDKTNRRGLGIYNIHQRLLFMFGDEYGLYYKNEPSGLRTIITLPYK